MNYGQQRITNLRRGIFILNEFPRICQNIPIIIPYISNSGPIVGNRAIRGFTLIELIITLTIATILLTVAVPGMSRFINNNRLSSVTNDFLGDLNLARSEALKRGSQAGMCKGNTSGCAGIGVAWANGWIVFADIDENETWSANDVLIRAHEALPPNTAITLSTGSNSAIVYGSQGQVVQGAPETITVCNSNVSRKRDIALIRAGRHAVTEGNC